MEEQKLSVSILYIIVYWETQAILSESQYRQKAERGEASVSMIQLIVSSNEAAKTEMTINRDDSNEEKSYSINPIG